MAEPRDVRRAAYLEKLKDPRWQRRRLEIFERDGWACQFCGDKTRTLHLHHRWYSPGDPWEATDEALVTLCEPCHEFEGGRSRFESELIEVLRKHYSAGEVEWLVALFDHPDTRDMTQREQLLEVFTGARIFPDLRDNLLKEYRERSAAPESPSNG